MYNDVLLIFFRLFLIQLPGKCDQNCQNLKGSYRCGCEPGYNLKPDNHTCKAYNEPIGNEPPSLLFADSINIKQVYLDTDNPSQEVKISGKLAISNKLYPAHPVRNNIS